MNISKVKKDAKEQLKKPDFQLLINASTIGCRTIVSTNNHFVMQCVLDACRIIEREGEEKVKSNHKLILEDFANIDKVFSECFDKNGPSEAVLGCIDAAGKFRTKSWTQHCNDLIEELVMSFVLYGNQLHVSRFKNPEEVLKKTAIGPVRYPTPEDDKAMLQSGVAKFVGV